MSAPAQAAPYEPRGAGRALESAAAWLLAVLWLLPLIYALWTAFHPAEFSVRFNPLAPLTLENFVQAWQAARSWCCARSPPSRSRASSLPGARSPSRWC
jgi:sn-glycerol 3-phosphate transport system permease protein